MLPTHTIICSSNPPRPRGGSGCGGVSTITAIQSRSVRTPTDRKILVCKGAEQVMVYDVLGRLQLSVPLNKDLVQNKINTATLAQGVYIVKIQRADQSVFTTKIIKE